MKRLLVLVFLVTMINSHGQPLSQQVARTAIHTWPDSFALPQDKIAKWRYDQGVILKGIEGIWNATGDGYWFNYIRKSMDFYVQEDGSIKGYKKNEFNIDHINNGKILLLLYKVTGKEKYLKAAQLLRSQLREHPRTSEGGFWHKKIYPYQMWLDGLYMGQPFYAEYAALMGEDTAFNDIARQFVLMEKHARDKQTGLLYHGWDESREQQWADKQTGLSPHFWGRALGWFGMAMVDVLDHFPKQHPGRDSIIQILNRFAKAVIDVQDKTTGLWYDVPDKKNEPANYFEASGSAMLVYTLAKGVRKGYLPHAYITAAKSGYDGIVKKFIKKDDAGNVNLHGTVSVSGLGGKPYRDGSFEYYMSEPVIVNDPKGIGAFILASVEIEMLEGNGIGKVLTPITNNLIAKKTADYKIVVSLDGSGDFKSIQAAINSFPSSAVHPRKIFIKNGIYREKIYLEKNNIWLIGENREKTIITQSIARDEWRCFHNEDWGVATLNISADDITLQNITVINNFGFEQNAQKTIACPNDSSGLKKITAQSHQMALRTMHGTRLKALNCHFKAFGGDTVSPWNVENGMFFFKDCIMEGGVDFYCPRGWAWAENCEFIVHTGSAAIWHDGSRYEDSKTVLKNCTFKGFDGFNLGRYHRDAQFFLIGCRFPSNMADRNIYLVPTSNQINWGHRVYYYGTKRDGGNFDWHADNLHTAKNSPNVEMITPQWLFGNRWDPEAHSQAATYVQLVKRNTDSSYGQPLSSEIMPSNHPANDFSKTSIPYYQSEGPVWENDKAGFRLYLDVRNAKDIFGKTTSNIVLDTVGTYGDKYYHQFNPSWGMDILKVGASLGAGSLALKVKDNQGKDTLVRLGGTQVEKTTYELVKNDVNEAVFRLQYKNWKVLDRVYQLTEEINIRPGDYFYTSTVTVNGLKGNERLVTGIVNFKSHNYKALAHGDKNILYTHDKQADDGSYLGMAVMTDKKYKPEYGITKNEGSGIVNSYTISLKAKNNEPVIFRFYAAWEQTDNQFSQIKYFENLLKQDAVKWSNKK